MNASAIFRYATPLLLLALGSLPTGCASPHDLTLTSVRNNQTFSHGFAQAYSRQDANGDTDVVLVDQATEDSLNGQSNSAPIRQVMHIRIVWSPTHEMKAIVSNAAVKWYVIGRQQPQDVLEYSGIAFVSMNQADDSTTLKVQNALLNPSPNHGSLTDPVGASRLEGTFVAKNNDQRVDQVLRDLKTATATANAAKPAVSSVDSSK